MFIQPAKPLTDNAIQAIAKVKMAMTPRIPIILLVLGTERDPVEKVGVTCGGFATGATGATTTVSDIFFLIWNEILGKN
ncbi:hypothetical protein pv_239 [Pithovirus sibericum]|uniref:Uncharacterized protein n=1 Tax=Pithovirus sibericum TaxID=1450746 RepID=W5S508_9VIRU|nr:hypothetical protein pv_239 [Pithovirus sibericum]AHH01806.1 hypothetical protein pv_239 [Pithovirus sibericum]